MTYKDFLKRVNHAGKINFQLISCLNLKGTYRHELDSIKEGADIEPSSYAYYIITGKDGTSFIVRDVIADENNFAAAY